MTELDRYNYGLLLLRCSMRFIQRSMVYYYSAVYISEKFPTRAEKLGVLYEDGVRFNKHQFDDLDRLEREEVGVQNAEVERRNAALEAWQAALEAERDQKSSKDRAALEALDKPLSEAHYEAARSVARVGCGYDPQNPSSDTVLRERPLPLEVVTGGTLPWTPGDDVKRVPEWLQMTLKVGVGFAVGLSIGFIAHLLSPDNLGAKAMEFVGCLFLGFVVAAGGGAAVRGTVRRASERYWMARFGSYGPSFWVPSLLFAGVIGLVLIGAEATIETLGLLAPAKLEEQNGGTVALPFIVFYMVGLIFTVGYLITQACEGSLDGRFDVCLNRAKALQHEEYLPRQKAERDDERVQLALEKLGLVREVSRQFAHLETRIAQIIAPFNQKIEALESMKRTPQNGLSLEARHRLRDAYDNWCGSNGDWHASLDALLDEIEPLRSHRHAAPLVQERRDAVLESLWKRFTHRWRARNR